MKASFRPLFACASLFASLGVASTASAAGWDVPWQKPVAPPVANLEAVIEFQYASPQVFWLANNGTNDPTPMVATLSGSSWSEKSLGGGLAWLTAAPMSGWGHEWAAGAQASGQVFVMEYDGANWPATWTATGGVTALVASPVAIAATGWGPRLFAVGTDYKLYVDTSWGMGEAWEGWSSLAALPDGQPAGRILAIPRGGNNHVALTGDPLIDVVVVTQNQSAVYHMVFNTQTNTGSWEPVPFPMGYAVADVEVTSVDMNTVDILMNLGGNTLALKQSSTPGSWVDLAVPQGVARCTIGGMFFTSPVPGEIKLWESSPKNTTIYTDLYSASPNTGSGIGFCQ